VSIYEQLFARLAQANVRYVVVGGVAVVLHGYLRATADLDLVIDLEETNARRAMTALERAGLEPLAPVRAAEFADAATRRRWIDTKNLRVFSLRDPHEPLLTVDVFAEDPLPFEELWTRSAIVRLGGCDVRIASIADLLVMKRAAARPQDAIDIEHLERIAKERTS